MYSLIGDWIQTDVGQYKIIEDIEGNSLCQKDDECDWKESKDICQKENGYLVRISSEKENSRILKVLSELKLIGSGFNFFIGLKYIGKNFIWSSEIGFERKIGYQNFKNGKALCFYQFVCISTMTLNSCFCFIFKLLFL